MRITSLQQGSANRLFRLEQRPGLILPSAPAFVNLRRLQAAFLLDSPYSTGSLYSPAGRLEGGPREERVLS